MKEERNDLKNEMTTGNKNVCELTEKEMAQVSGGEDERQPCPYWEKPASKQRIVTTTKYSTIGIPTTIATDNARTASLPAKNQPVGRSDRLVLHRSFIRPWARPPRRQTRVRTWSRSGRCPRGRCRTRGRSPGRAARASSGRTGGRNGW